MRQIWTAMPKQIDNLCNELQKIIADELSHEKICPLSATLVVHPLP